MSLGQYQHNIRSLVMLSLSSLLILISCGKNETADQRGEKEMEIDNREI